MQLHAGRTLLDHFLLHKDFGTDATGLIEEVGKWDLVPGSRGGRQRHWCVSSASLKQKEETWVDYYARACKTARKIWVQKGLTFLYEVIAESMWRAMGWSCDEKPNAVINTSKVYSNGVVQGGASQRK